MYDTSIYNRNYQRRLGKTTPLEQQVNIYEQTRLNAESNCLIPSSPSSRSVDPRKKLIRTRQCIFFYLHFHKSGGTTICSMMTQEKYSSNPADNCLPSQEYRHREYEYTQLHNFTFIAQEGPFFEPNLTSNKIIYFTTIRHPYDRIISHLHHEICERTEKESREYLETMGCTDINISTATLADVILADCMKESMQGITSNFYLHILTNCRGLNCTEESLKEAIAKLDIMSVILITDTPEDYSRYANLLNLKFSINYQSTYRSGTRHHSSSQLLFKTNQTAYERLEELNHLDYQFYLYCLHLAHKRYAIEESKYHLNKLPKSPPRNPDLPVDPGKKNISSPLSRISGKFKTPPKQFPTQSPSSQSSLLSPPHLRHRHRRVLANTPPTTPPFCVFHH